MTDMAPDHQTPRDQISDQPTCFSETNWAAMCRIWDAEDRELDEKENRRRQYNVGSDKGKR